MKQIMALLWMLCFGALSGCVHNPPQESLFFVGSRVDTPIDAISLFSLDQSSGEISKIRTFDSVRSADYFSVSPDKKYLYAVDTASVDDQSMFESVAAFRLNAETGHIDLMNRQSTFGNGSCYLSTTPDNRYLLVANYITGNLVVLPIREDGSLAPVVSIVQNEGSGPNKDRQDKAHSHYIHVSKTGRHVLSADLGTDKVMNYTLSATGQLEPNVHQPFVEMPPGGGPRHLAFHDNGRNVYILNELTSSISASYMDPDTGVVTIIETHDLLPSDYDGFNKSSAIRIHPNGKFLYASNPHPHWQPVSVGHSCFYLALLRCFDIDLLNYWGTI